MKDLHIEKGVSIVEMLIVISIFAVLGVVVTQSLALSLRGTNKSENVNEVRQNTEYVLSIIERKIRNADGIDTSDASCTMNNTRIDLIIGDEIHRISCQEPGGIGVIYINENEGDGDEAFSNPNIDFECSLKPVFSCNTTAEPDYVDIILEASHASATGAESAAVSVQTRVSLRNYR